MRYLTLREILEIYQHVMRHSGGFMGIRDLGALDSAVAQPRMTFDGDDLYPTLVEKAVSLGFSLILNHPFIDGNKRVAHATMETFLLLNGYEIEATVDEQEQVILSIASGKMNRDEVIQWLKVHIKPRS